VIGSLVLAGTTGVRTGAADPVLLLDQQHQRTIHQAMVTFGERNADGSLPMPGRINRFTSSSLGRQQGVGPENYKKDSSGHLYSAMIAQEYIDTTVVISPGERNPVVSEYGTSTSDASTQYDYDAYDPASDTFWMGDEADPVSVAPGASPQGGPNQIFLSKINRRAPYGRSHTSYAHLMFAGQRRLDWNVKASSDRVLLGTRGPKYGEVTGDEYRRSPTLLFFGDPEVWVGNVVRGDGRVERLEQGEVATASTAPVFGFRDLVFQCGDERPVPDNIFNTDVETCIDVTGYWKMRDAWLAMNELVTDDGGPKTRAIYDYLED
jgi:hypothetical protein